MHTGHRGRQDERMRRHSIRMNSLIQSIRRHDGLASTSELYADGHSRSALSAAADAGLVIRVRQGWYSTPDVHPSLLEAARVGGRLTCLSALGMHGCWTYPTTDLHVAVPGNACRLRTRRSKITRLADVPEPGVRTHWRDDSAGHRLLRAPIDCLADLIACQQPDAVTAVADSALHKYPWLHDEWRLLVLRSPTSKQKYLSAIDGVCESGTESIFFMRTSPLGLPMRRQEQIPGVGRVDFLIGTKLVIEIDGAEYHTDPVRFEADRHRDAVLSRMGYRVLRFSYRQVMYAWDEVESAVLAAVVRGDHH